MELSNQLSNLRTGHVLLVACCIFYLIWWSITFNPMQSFPSVPKYILFICTAVSGLAGVVFVFGPLGQLPQVNGSVSNLVIVFAGAAVYAALLYVTGHFMHRQVTTELFLIVGWTVLELCILSSVYSADAVSLLYAMVMAATAVIAAVISMMCYLKYYDMEPVAAFYDGMVPLVLFGIYMAAQAVMIK